MVESSGRGGRHCPQPFVADELPTIDLVNRVGREQGHPGFYVIEVEVDAVAGQEVTDSCVVVHEVCAHARMVAAPGASPPENHILTSIAGHPAPFHPGTFPPAPGKGLAAPDPECHDLISRLGKGARDDSRHREAVGRGRRPQPSDRRHLRDRFGVRPCVDGEDLGLHGEHRRVGAGRLRAGEVSQQGRHRRLRRRVARAGAVDRARQPGTSLGTGGGYDRAAVLRGGRPAGRHPSGARAQ